MENNEKGTTKREIIREEYEKALQELPRKEFDLSYSMEIKKVPYQPSIHEHIDKEEGKQYVEIEKYYHIV